MRLAVIGSSHGCWACTSTQKFPNVTLKEAGPVTMRHIGDKVKIQVAWHIEADSKSALAEYLKHLQTIPSLKRVEMLSNTGQKGMLVTEWRHENSPYDVVVKNNAFPIAPIVEQNGYDIQTVLCESPRQLKNLMSSMNEIGDTKILKVGKFKPDERKFNLTEKQLQALAIASYNNYYSWPRNITLEELAGIANTSRRAFQEHLRRAEAKALPRLLKDVLEMNPHKQN